MYTWQIEPHWLDIVRRPLPIRDLPDSLSGRTLAQLIDIHVGPRVDDAYVLETFRRVTALNPDIVVFTGDFVSYHSGFLDQLRPVYDHAPRGRLATVGILGNHDYGPAWRHPEIAAQIAGALDQRGIRILRNEVAEVGGLAILGLDDLWAHQFDLETGLARLPREAAALVLSHNPDTADRPGWET